MYKSLASIHHDKLAEKVGGRFRLTRLIAQRMRDLNAGAPLLVERGENEALIAAVCREIDEELISLDMPETTIMSVDEDQDFDDLLGLGDTL